LKTTYDGLLNFLGKVFLKWNGKMEKRKGVKFESRLGATLSGVAAMKPYEYGENNSGGPLANSKIF
jgi:hypothetical protein